MMHGILLLVARCTSLACITWMLLYLCWGSTPSGKRWFQDVVAGHFLPVFSWLSSPSFSSSSSLLPLDFDKAAIVPILTLPLPILVAGTTCALLLLLQGDGHHESRRHPKESSRASRARVCTGVLCHGLTFWILESWQHCVRLLRQQAGRLSFLVPSIPCFFRVGDKDRIGATIAAVVFIIAPLSIYAFTFVHRYWTLYTNNDDDNDDKLTLADQVAIVGNAVGMAGTVAMSLVLIPVSRHSPILQCMSGSSSWSSPVHAIIYLHHNAGRIVLIGGLLHSALHAYRYMILLRLSIYETIIEQGNVTGLFGTLALVVLAVTTLRPVRRAWYALFWTSHAVAVPFAYVMIILHDSKVILYISGGLLYYLATTLPVWMETTIALSSLLCCTRSKKEQQQTSDVRIVAVQYIPPGPDGRLGGDDRATDVSSGCVVSVTIQVDAVALERFRAGQYVRLVAPEISIVAHPFTMIICHPRSSRRNQQRRRQQQQQQHTDGQDDDKMTTNEIDGENGSANSPGSDGRGDYHCMQIMFRATGNFTKQLAERLVVGTDSTHTDHENATLPRLPVLRLDGFYGASNRLRTALLQHDVILLVAGGIGITPYLSLLHQLHQNLVVSRRQAKRDELQEQELQHQQFLVLQQGTSADISFGADYDSSSRHNRQFRTKRIVVHWMCRDAALIDYIKREYFSLLLDDSSTDSNSGRNDSIDNDFCMQLVIHQTGIPASTTRRIITATTVWSDCDIIHNPRDDDDDQNRTREQHELVTAEQPIVMGVPFRPSKFAAATKTSYLGNAPLLLSFLLIGWIGLIILWFCYTNLVSSQHRHGLVPRSLGMVCLLIWSITIAVVLNWIFTPATQNDIDETRHDDVEESTPTLSLQAEMAKKYCYTALHQTDQQGGINNNDTSSAAGIQEGTLLHDTTFGDGASVNLEERCGRPNVCEFLHVFDDHNNRANYPAVYACGPNDLTKSLREAITERGRCKIALYQESFEM